MSERFEKQLEYFKLHPEVDMVGGAINEIDENGDPWEMDNPFNGSDVFSWANNLYAVWYTQNVLSKLDKFDRLKNAWIEVNPATEFPGSGPAFGLQIAYRFWTSNGKCNNNMTCKTKRNN